MGKYPAYTAKRRTNWCETLFHLQLIPSQASELGLTHAAEKAARFQSKPWLQVWKAGDYTCCGKQKSAMNFPPQEILERKARQAVTRIQLRASASLPIRKQRGSSSPGEDTFPLTDSKSQSLHQKNVPPGKAAQAKNYRGAQVVRSRCCVSVITAISLLSPMLSSGVDRSSF